MSMTGLDAFDFTVLRTNVFAHELMDELAWRGISYEEWDPSGKPLDERREHLARELAEPDSKALARAVFEVMLRPVGDHELVEPTPVMPAALGELWR